MSLKGENIIWLELYIFFYLYSVLIVSFFRTGMTDPGKIPDDQIWNIDIPDSIPSEMQLELFAVTLGRREEMLQNNRNIITEETLNESRSTASKYL